MLRVKPSYYAPVDKKMTQFFYDAYFAPILAVLPEADTPRIRANNRNVRENSSTNALLQALSSGRVIYKDGVFSGSFNASISMNLATFAKFDRRTKKWYGRPTSNVLASAIMANDKRARMLDAVKKEIDALADRVDETIKTLSFGVDLPLFAMNQDVEESLPIGVRPTLDERTAEKLLKDYTESQKLNVKNWTPDQIQRLREMVERYQTTPGNESLRDMIMREWGVSANKAQFLARQETSLFFSKFSMNRAASAGVRKYRWSTSHDSRVRNKFPGRAKNAPNHEHLDGEIFTVDGPGGIVDLKTGRRAHPGEDYNCRCAAIWVLE